MEDEDVAPEEPAWEELDASSELKAPEEGLDELEESGSFDVVESPQA
jgi:hypothetical protein